MSVTLIKGFRLALLAGASALAATAAYAQEEASATTVGEQAEVEELVVVGSQIKGAKVTDVLPVTVMEVEDIEATGATSGDDLFRAIPQAGDVTFNESRMAGGINDARGDTNSINLRALGTGNTLMLLNGRRMVLHPAIQVENLVPVATVNTNAIPVMGIRRIEVLRDGASAVYGTDAVAGVVNTVLKSNFDGFTMTAEGAFAEGTAMQEFSLDFEAGRDFNGGRTNLSMFGSYTQRDPLWASERRFSRDSNNVPLVVGTPFETETDFNNTSTDTIWGEFQRLNPTTFATVTTATSYNGVALTTNGIFHVQPSGNEGCVAPAGTGICYDNSSLSTASTDANLRYNTNADRTLWGGVDRVNLFAFFNHELENGLEVFAEAGVFYSEYFGSREQDTNLATQRLIIPINGYWNPLGAPGSPNRLPGLTGAANGSPLELIDYRPVDAGAQTIEVDQTVTRYLAGVRGEWNTWDWESAFVYSRAETDDTMRSLSLTLFQEALGRTTSDAYNPFNGGDPVAPDTSDSTPNPASVIDDFVVDISRASHTSMAMWDFKVSNPEVIRNWAGSVGVAAGVELRRETYGDDRDSRLDGTITYTDLAGVTSGSDVIGVSPTPDTSGARSVQSAYVEVALPIVSAEMNIPLIRSIDMQLAGRWENYTTFGSVAKPKIALSYYPVEWLQFRTAWSQGFRAPNLPQIYERGIIRSNSRTDWIRCEAGLRRELIANFNACTASGTPVPGQSVSVQSNRSGSETLNPEESENFTAGVVFQPVFIPSEFGRLTLTVDYWLVEQTDIIGLLGDANALILDYLLRVQGSSNPNVIRADPTAAEELFFNPVPGPGVIDSGLEPVGRVTQVIDNYRNLGPREVEGMDFGVFYEIGDTPFGDFDIKLNAAKLMTFFQTPGPEQQMLLDAQEAGVIDDTVISIAGAEGLIEENGRPEWRVTGTATWRMGPWGAGYFTSYVSGVNDTSAVLADGTQWRVDENQTHNLYVQYTVDADGWADGTRVRFGARNFTDVDAPLSDNDLGFNGDIHSPRGRTWYAQIRKRF